MRTVASTLPSFDTYLSMWSEYFIKIWIKKKKKKKQFPINFQSQINIFFSKDIFINCKKVNMMNMILADRCTFKKEKKYKKCLRYFWQYSIGYFLHRVFFFSIKILSAKNWWHYDREKLGETNSSKARISNYTRTKKKILARTRWPGLNVRKKERI